MQRRDVLKTALVTPFLRRKPISKLKIVLAGAHPDDPETGAGGSAARWQKEGHEVHIAYLTKGEAGIEGISPAKAAEIREKEALEACAILQARAHFLGQIDGNCEVNTYWYDLIKDFLKEIQPDVLLTHWPLDTHRDHRACSVLFYDAWLYLNQACPLYFYEVMSGIQTQNFHPTHYIDISETIEIKHKACFVHKSQKIKETYAKDHGKMEAFRGLEAGVSYAEAFVKHMHSLDSPLFLL